MKNLWKQYLLELRNPPLIGPGLRTNLPPRLRQVLHTVFTTFRYVGYYLLFKPIGGLLIVSLCRLHVQGRENLLYDRSFIGTMNHLSQLDPVVGLFVANRPLFAMAKAEYFKTPLLGSIATALGGFPVRRGAADRQAVRTALGIVKIGGVTCIYPEGTRSKTYQLQPAHPGAAMIAATSDVPVIPSAIWGSENLMRKRKLGFLKRPRIDFKIGQPYNLKEATAAFMAEHQLVGPATSKRSRHTDFELMSDIMMLKIADLLPAEYRGEFTPEQLVQRYHTRNAQRKAAATAASEVESSPST
jgi:1-acyl-sn-glycerol-3-phosphate acyltransferase